MQAINRPFTAIINGNTQFLIPVFQRDYTWTEEQCDRLWEDIRRAGVGADKGHFLGSIVYVAAEDSAAGFTRWLLIDGQQRLTSLTLLMIALRDYIKDADWSGGEDSPTPEQIDAFFLKNMYQSVGRRYKLVLRRTDHDTLHALVDNKELPEHYSSLIVDAYKFFRQRLEECADPDLVYRGATDLVIVDVTLQRHIDDPQLVFESLNSTGVDLSQSDLIRNYLLMGIEESDQTRLYSEYWGKVEGLFRKSGSALNSFLRDYVALETQATRQTRDDRVYEEFKKTFLSSDIESLERLLKDLVVKAHYYAAFMIGDQKKGRLDEAMRNVRRLAVVPAILVTRLYDCHERGSLSENEFIQALTLIESYILRRAICGRQTRGYWTIFATLARQLDDRSPLESLKARLYLLYYGFPKDEQFKRALVEEDLYGRRILWHLLERLENAETKEPSDTSEYSIEHVMPQNENLAAAWKEMLGPNWQDVQMAWLHRLGNLTLTAYNSRYSDKPFQEKMTIKGGFKDSAVRLNRFISDQCKWTANEMEERGQRLAERSLEIWPSLKVDKSSIDKAKAYGLQQRATLRRPEDIDMSDIERELLVALQKRVIDLDDNVIEIVERKSISYHRDAKFFLEVIPRKGYLALIMPLDFAEVDIPDGLPASDATEWKFIPNANYDAGLIVDLAAPDHIESLMPLIRQAFTVDDQ